MYKCAFIASVVAKVVPLEHHKMPKWRAFGESLDFGYNYTVLFTLHCDFIAQICFLSLLVA